MIKNENSKENNFTITKSEITKIENTINNVENNLSDIGKHMKMIQNMINNLIEENKK